MSHLQKRHSLQQIAKSGWRNLFFSSARYTLQKTGLLFWPMLARRLQRVLFELASAVRISPRRASVLAYITSQLLHSHRAIARESNPQTEQQWIVDLPRPRA